MSRNGSGTYTLPAGNPVVTGTTITSTWANTSLSDIAAALTGSVAADGQTPMTGTLNMTNNTIENVSDPTSAQDAATKAYVDLTQTASGITGGTITGAVLTNDTIDSTPIGNTTRSTVKATTLDLGLSTQSVAIGQGNASIIKNRLINGAMIVNQRNASITSSGMSVDRWGYQASQASKATVAQSSTAPTGFINSMLATSSSAYSVTSTDYFSLGQKIEGFNIADLDWGTANAKTVTLSFWVRSSLTGTFGGSLQNQGNDGQSTPNYSYPFTYTISAANTWEQKTITIAGPTSGTWVTNNLCGINVNFGLGVGTTLSGTANTWAVANYYSVTGATSVVGTNGATFYITGVQLEVGSSATGFEYVNYQTSLANCQRYYLKESYIALTGDVIATFPVTMRTTPTVTSSVGTANDPAPACFRLNNAGTSGTTITASAEL